ncbi:MAG: hypothetical protein M3Y56_04835, partial [Armatimonadota bacterium]|nr:hypothetical protein [Armatimonadota bacterium]
ALLVLLPVLERTRAGQLVSWLLLCGTLGAAVVLSHRGHDFISVLHHGRQSSHFKGALEATALLALGAWQAIRLLPLAFGRRLSFPRSSQNGLTPLPGANGKAETLQSLPQLPPAAWALMIVALLSGVTMILPAEGLHDISRSDSAHEALRKAALFLVELFEQFGISLFLFLLVLRSPGRIRLAIRVFLFAAFVCVAVAFWQYLHLHPADIVSDYSYRGGAIEIKGLMQSRRAYGGMLCLALPLALGSLLGARRRVVKVSLALFIGLALLTILSGPAFWCCLLAMVATGFFYNQKAGLQVAGACVLAAVFILALRPINRTEVVSRFMHYRTVYPSDTGATDAAAPAATGAATTPDAITPATTGAAIPPPVAVPTPTAAPAAAAPSTPAQLPTPQPTGVIPAPVAVGAPSDNAPAPPPVAVDMPAPAGGDMAPPPASGGDMPPPPDPGSAMAPPAPSAAPLPQPAVGTPIKINRAGVGARQLIAPTSRAGSRTRGPGQPPAPPGDSGFIPPPAPVDMAPGATGGDMAPPPTPVVVNGSTNSGDMAPPPGMEAPAPAPAPQAVTPAPGTVVNPPASIAPGTTPPTTVAPGINVVPASPSPAAPGTVPVSPPPAAPATTGTAVPGAAAPVLPPATPGTAGTDNSMPPPPAGDGAVAPPSTEGAPDSSGLSIKKEYEEWVAGIYMASEHLWLGVGPGQYQLNVGQYYGSNPNSAIRLEPDSNNLYTVYGASLGLAGLIALLQLVLSGLSSSWRTARNAAVDSQVPLAETSDLMAWWSTPEGRALAAGVCGAFTAFLVINMFSALLVRGTGIIFAFLLALAATMPMKNKLPSEVQ